MLISVLNVAHSNELIKETEIATVLNDETKTVYKLVLADHDDRKIVNVYKDVYEFGKKVRRDAMNPKIISEKGMVLEERKSHIVLQLMSQNLDLEQGGLLIVDTLFNGMTGERRNYEVQLAKDNNGWKLFKNGKAIKEIFIQTNKSRFFGSIGIKNVTMK